MHLLLNITTTIDDVTTTLLREEILAQEPKTLRVPFKAGSSNSGCKKDCNRQLQFIKITMANNFAAKGKFDKRTN